MQQHGFEVFIFLPFHGVLAYCFQNEQQRAARHQSAAGRQLSLAIVSQLEIEVVNPWWSLLGYICSQTLALRSDPSTKIPMIRRSHAKPLNGWKL